MIKKLIFTLIILTCTTFIHAAGQSGTLEVGKKAPTWSLPDANGKEFTMDSWQGKVLQINYVDPDESNINDAFNDAIYKAIHVDKRIDKEIFTGLGIVDIKSTWKPKSLIRVMAANRTKKFNTTILFDYDASLRKLWGLPADSYSVVIFDKNKVCRAVYKGKIPESENEKIIQLIIALTKE